LPCQCEHKQARAAGHDEEAMPSLPMQSGLPLWRVAAKK
jgi:hypothetical protein